MKMNVFESCTFSIVILFLFTSCNKDDCKYVEYFEDNSPKLKMCTIDEDKSHYCYEELYNNGKLALKFCLIDGEFEGEVIEYYTMGAVKKITTYVHGKKHGDYSSYKEDGRLSNYNYFYEGHPCYIETYEYDNNQQKISVDGFNPILTFDSGTIFAVGDTFRFKVSLPVPDSLLKGRELYFAYQMKSIGLKDSVIVHPANEALITNKTEKSFNIILDTLGKQIFYGHLVHKEENLFYNSFEQIIEVVPSLPDG
ncbi:MAG: hypothetical protein MI974_25030 [Chitinophagales bacterium]|nr:hypothetical protein [Chitinophagales bacterium]